MPTKIYHKLVRDRIPEIIEADGKTCVCETLSDEDYLYLCLLYTSDAADE